MMTSDSSLARHAASQAYCNNGLPVVASNSLRGSRVDCNRAGMIPIVRMRELQ